MPLSFEPLCHIAQLHWGAAHTMDEQDPSQASRGKRKIANDHAECSTDADCREERRWTEVAQELCERSEKQSNVYAVTFA